MSDRPSRQRPTGVSAIGVILLIQGIVGIAAGIALIAYRNDGWLLDKVDESSDQIVGIGVAAIVGGVILLLLSRSVWRGANWARIVIGIVEVLHAAGGVYLIIRDTDNVGTGIGQIVIAVVVIRLLFSPQATSFFVGGRATG